MPVVSGSGGGGIATASLSLTHAQILTLPTNTSHLVVPAPGAGKMVVPIWAVFSCDSTAGAYTNFNNNATIKADFFASSVSLQWDAPNNATSASGPAVAGISDISGGNLLDLGGKAIATVNGVSGLGLSVVVGAGQAFDFFEGAFIAGFGIEDAALYVVAGNSTKGNFTGGNAANTLKATVAYFVASV